MAKQKDKMYMPMGAGGLMRYQDEEEEMFVIKPKHIVAIVVALIALEIFVKIFLV
jgi:preprotein translocase subunit Sec61beta